MTENFHLESHFLAVSDFRPGEEVSDERRGEVTLLWTGRVFEKYGSCWKDILRRVLRSSSDVQYAHDKQDALRECRILHLLDSAKMGGFSLSVAPATSKNPPARSTT